MASGPALPTVLYILYDEATNASRCSLSEELKCEAAIALLLSWIDRHGIPEALRCRRTLICPENPHLSLEQQLAGTEPCTPLSTACEKLGVDLRPFRARELKTILSHVEPLIGIIAREFAAGRVAAVATANAVLAGAVGKQLNRTFATRPDLLSDCHVPIIDGTNLHSIFSLEAEYRVVLNARIALSG